MKIGYTKLEYVEYGNTENHLVETVIKNGLYGAIVEESASDLMALGYSRVSEQLTGNPAGCAPIVSVDYTFVGWFKDESCTMAVDPTIAPVILDENGNLIPKRSDSDGNGIFLYEGGVYYAKFDYNFSTLTITVEQSSDEDQSFLFVVQGVDGTASVGVNITVPVNGNSSVTLENVRVGDYTVTQVLDWSYRYTPDGGAMKTISIFPGNDNKNVTFVQMLKTDKWLDGSGMLQLMVYLSVPINLY